VLLSIACGVGFWSSERVSDSGCDSDSASGIPAELYVWRVAGELDTRFALVPQTNPRKTQSFLLESAVDFDGLLRELKGQEWVGTFILNDSIRPDGSGDWTEESLSRSQTRKINEILSGRACVGKVRRNGPFLVEGN
jgi:hypothetical protein